METHPPIQLWRVGTEPAGGRRWMRCAIPERGLAFALDARGALFLGDEPPRDAQLVARLVPVNVRGVREAALVVAPDALAVLVGGFPPLGVALVEDRSEIRIGLERLYLTRIAAASVEAFDAADPGAVCGRCTRALRRGDSVLRCGSCGTRHHEGERAEGAGSLLCASYSTECAGCRRSWDAIRWAPDEDLE